MTTVAQYSHNIPKLPISETGLDCYLRQVRKFPMLTHEQEIEYARNLQENGDINAAHHLVTSHLRLVVKIAMGFKGYGLPLNELISEGNIGLMQAVKKFDPERGFRLTTYAMWWIRAAIQEYVLHSWSLVKMGTTTAQKKLFFNLRKLRGSLRAYDDMNMSNSNITEIAKELNVPEFEVVNMSQRLAAPDHSLNTPLKDSSLQEWQDWIADDRIDQETELAERQDFSIKKDFLDKALFELKKREKEILFERRLTDKPKTLEELSEVYGISRERVRQIEVRAFEKIQKSIVKMAQDQRISA